MSLVLGGSERIKKAQRTLFLSKLLVHIGAELGHYYQQDRLLEVMFSLHE